MTSTPDARSDPATPPKGSGSSPDGAKAAGRSLRDLPASEIIDDTVYLGIVKSYNDRRGFGFIACAAAAAAYGRDVYITKIDAQNAAAVAAGLPPIDEAAQAAEKAAAAAAAEAGEGPTEKPAPAPRLHEEDMVKFCVRLSVEGFPQAALVELLSKRTGSVIAPPAEEDEDDVDPEARNESVEGSIACRELDGAAVSLKREDCGQVRLVAGDEVAFCTSQTPDADRNPGKAMLLLLTKTDRPPSSVLGCFALDLPRPTISTSATEGDSPAEAPKRDNLLLDCHALGDKVILAGLPADTNEAELMRFFSKQGATSTIVAHARGCSFASVSFPSTNEVARFLGRCSHAFADDKETRVARLVTGRRGRDAPKLPALPAPSLAPGGEDGTLLVIWSPLVLAVGYAVEFRLADGHAPWATVDVAAGRLGAGSQRFDAACSSCKVNGLQAVAAYESRVTYFTSCGCRSEASDPSAPCIAAPQPQVAAPDPDTLWSLGAGGGGAPGHLPPVPPAWQTPWPGMPDMMQLGAGGYDCPPVSGPGPPLPMPPSVPGTELPREWPPYITSPGWRCCHGSVIPPPAQPELRPADDLGFAMSIQWPSVAPAASYVVELREAGSTVAERFARAASIATAGSLVELRVGGLRPGLPPGRMYMAHVRAVALCGCESSPSPSGWSPPLGSSPAPTSQPPLSVSAPPPSELQPQHQPGGSWMPPPWLGYPPASTSPGPAPDTAAPQLGALGAPPVSPPTEPPPMHPGWGRGAPPGPEAGGADNCLILD